MASAKPPGRLGDPTMSPETDPRIHPQLLEAMRPFNLQASSIPQEGPTFVSPLDEILAHTRTLDEGMVGFYGAVNYDHVPSLDVKGKTTRSEEFVTTEDGYKMKLIVYRPVGSEGTALPAVIYSHGGGMTIVSTDNYVHTTWLEAIASTGLIAIATDYRNASTAHGHYPFPTGLNDCAAAVKWIAENKEKLGISKIILEGESGGGNLAIATALKAKKEGWIDLISGVFAVIPYISGAYGASDEWKLQNLPSLIECDGYFISSGMMAVLTKVYDPTGENAKNPLAWPYWVDTEDLKGLPPFFVLTNELDPLRDEGNEFYRKLSKAGVRVTAKMNSGMVHGGEILLRHAVPDHFLANVAEIKAFVDRV